MEVSCNEQYKVTTRIQTNHYQRTKILPFIHTDEEGLVYIFFLSQCTCFAVLTEETLKFKGNR